MSLNRRQLLRWAGGSLVLGLIGPLASQLTGAEPVASARWIWPDRSPGVNEWVAFRRSFTFPGGSHSPRLRVASADKYWLWINGALIVREGGLKSGPTPRDWYVDEWDVSKALRAGKNQIAVLVWHFGRPGASHRHTGQGGLYLELTAGAWTLGSDATWKAKRHPAFGQKGGGTSVTLAEQAVDFDARREMSGWTENDHDDSVWPAAVEVGLPSAEPWGRLVARPIPAWEDDELADYENRGEWAYPVMGPATVTGRLPANLQVYPFLEVRAPAGREIYIQIERDKKRTRYVTREGEQAFEVPAWGNGHFVTYTIPEGVEVRRVGYRKTGYASRPAGRFVCSDEALNRLWAKAVQTAHVCMRDSYMDCPDRERSAWPGDAANIVEITLRGLDRRSDLLFGKAARELAGWASPNGNLWGAVPTSRFSGSFREFPAQTLLFLGFALPSYGKQTGDKETLAAIYPAMQRYLFDLWTVKEGVVEHRGPWQIGWDAGVQSWYDWGQNVDAEALDQVLYFAALGGLEEAAKTLGHAADAGRCAKLRDEMRRVFDGHFWKEGEKAYRSTRHHGSPDERVQALAVVTHLAPFRRWNDLADRIEKSSKCSIYMERFPLEALVMAGRPENALRRMKERFAFEIASDYSTLPEEFGQDSNHAWGGAAIVLLAEKLMGVSILEPGYRKVRFDPPAGLEFGEYTIPTVHGDLRLDFRRNPGGITFRLRIPRNIQVTVPEGAGEKTYSEGTWVVGQALP